MKKEKPEGAGERGGEGVRVDVDRLRRTLRYHGVTNEGAGKMLGVTRDSFQRRLRDASFRVHEVHVLMEAVPLTDDEVWQIFFAK